jgi:hypothetical protein
MNNKTITALTLLFVALLTLSAVYPCAITAGNACAACANQDVDYYTQGECPTQNNPNVDGPTIEYKEPNKACTKEYMPICVTLSDGSKYTAGNNCEATNIKNVASQTPGECN